MFSRELKFPKSKSFFLFGARGTGKSTLLRERFAPERTYTVDLLLPAVEERLARHPDGLLSELRSLPLGIDTVVLDEVQKVPKLLDVVHYYLENAPRPLRFVLTGSSARKLKKGGANLLAGRAFIRDLYPLVIEELGEQLRIGEALAWGTLPYIFALNDDEEKQDYLSSYIRIYVSEEIQREQIVRNLDPFRRFLEVAAQYNGKIINSILEDTLLGHMVLPFSHSFRKRLIKSPKFYFFDTGVCRAMSRTLSVPLRTGTSMYGETFEQFVVPQVIHSLRYRHPDAKVSFYKDENDIEVDLVVEIPGRPLHFIEIKSATSVMESYIKSLKIVRKDLPDATFELWSQDSIRRTIGGIVARHWTDGLRSMIES